MSPPTDIDIAAITKIANQLAEREEFILEKQQWRDNEDRIRAYETVQNARKKWIETVKQTHEKDHEHGEAKLEVLSTLVTAVQPSNLQPMANTQLRFEYIGEVSDATQASLDVIVAGQHAKIEEAVKAAQQARKVLAEIAEARASRAVNSWVSIVNQGRGPNQAFKSAVNRVVEEIFPDRMGKKLTLYESAVVQATAIEKAGRSTLMSKLVKGLKESGTIRAIVIGLTLLVVDVVNSALDGGPEKAITTAIKGVVGLAAGTAAGIAAENFLVSTILAEAGAVTTAVLGAAAGAIAGFVVGLAIGIVMDALIELITGAFEVNERKYWDAYMSTPIVYRVDIAN